VSRLKKKALPELLGQMSLELSELSEVERGE
jgi:hypothetical protein